MLLTMIPLLAGLLLSAIPSMPQVTFSRDTAFFLLLPPILFQGGLHLNLKNLITDWKPIALLSIPGVIVCALLVGYPLFLFWHIPLAAALLFGALISPTDPVSVLAIIRKMKSPERLRTILEAESLFNDGTGVVLFMVFLTILEHHTPLNLGMALIQFILLTGGGAIVGGLCGYMAFRLIKIMNGFLWTFLVSAVLVFGTPILSEKLHCSGIMAIVTAGLVLGQTKLCPAVAKFWETAEFVLNVLIFLTIGLQLKTISSFNLLGLAPQMLAAITLVQIARAMIVYPTLAFTRGFFASTMPKHFSHVVFWGGLRGTIPVILMMQLPDASWRPLFLCATFCIVLFSTFVQGLTIEGLLKMLKFAR